MNIKKNNDKCIRTEIYNFIDVGKNSDIHIMNKFMLGFFLLTSVREYKVKYIKKKYLNDLINYIDNLINILPEDKVIEMSNIIFEKLDCTYRMNSITKN
tara:strand:+ start:1527 stop:1823 length:297 start_codon:yes stop_codon:yes gene_type:complete